MATHELKDGTILDTGSSTASLAEEVMTSKEVADLLAIGKLSLGYARIPSIKIGGNDRLYLASTVLAWLRSREGKA